MSAYLGSFFGLALVLAVHFGAEHALGTRRHRKTLLNVIAGVAIAYAFVDVFPLLARKQASIDTLDLGVLEHYLANHLYLVALVGFCVYVGIRVFSASEVNRRHSGLAYGLMVLSMCIYAMLIGYMIAEKSVYRPQAAFLFGIAMGAHFLGLHHELLDARPRVYEKAIRYLLISCTAVGWLGSLLYTVSEPVYVMIFAYITGGIIAVGAISDLPRVKSVRALGPFVAGALVFSALLLTIEAYRLSSAITY